MTWTAPVPVRDDAPYVAGERAMLDGWLDFHRQTLLTKCAGLTAEQLRTPAVPPSDLTLLGLVRHMSVVERFWFRRAAAGLELPDLYDASADPDADFHDLAHADPIVDLATFAAECAASRETVAGMSLDHIFVSRRGRDLSLRWVYHQMINEYARHSGHADLLRERIDGVTGV